MSRLLPMVEPGDLTALTRRPVDPETLLRAAEIVEDIRDNGEKAVRDHSERLGDLDPGEPFVMNRDRLDRALEEIPDAQRLLLEQAADRIRRFAEAQLATLTDLDIEVPGGRAGHTWLPVSMAGAYAPGGRHPLPSSVLMTVIPARVAGVGGVSVASPRADGLTAGAAALAGADVLLRLGGAQAVAALAFGIGCPPSDVIAGPGNRWVTAAKKHLYGEVGIDGLAGPSEIVVVADDDADPGLVAADLLAQAEHDPDALSILVTTSRGVAEATRQEVERQLVGLPTGETAAQALTNGFALVTPDLEDAARIANALAPEHLALHLADAEARADRFTSYGALFIGAASAEVFADYGAGPNHVLPTGGAARYQSGLSVLSYMRNPTWLHLTDPGPLQGVTSGLARLEGLEAHARAAQWRSPVQEGLFVHRASE